MTIFSNNYLSNKPMEHAMKRFAKHFSSHHKILDIGCGNTPYKSLFKCKYIGLDPLQDVHPDLVGDAWDISLPDNHVDGIILNQSLEHIAETEKTIQELYRVLKPGGLGIITVPQTMKNHSCAIPHEKAPIHNFNPKQVPYWHVDYYRFTKFGLIYLFKDFKILSIKETNGYFSTILQLINYFFASSDYRWLFTPIFFINNILGITIDFFFTSLSKIKLNFFHRLHHHLYTELTINYVMVIQKPENS